MEKIIIRPAMPDDAEFLAQVVVMAIRDDEMVKRNCGGDDYLKVLTEVSAAEGTQYSYQNALVAQTTEGEKVGAILGYDGAELHALRKGTWDIISSYTGFVPEMADETEEGEFYLDSLGVMPTCRGLGVGEKLIQALCEMAFAQGHKNVGLIVDKENPRAEELYTRIGFNRVGERIFFTHQMYHLQRSKN
jgi:ribosomal protein S18 acetylase RimI-like enzyme